METLMLNMLKGMYHSTLWCKCLFQQNYEKTNNIVILVVNLWTFNH